MGGILQRAAGLGGAALSKLQHTRIPGDGQASTTEPADVAARRWRTVTCGSDLHLIGGYIPAMRSGDVLGHESLGTVVEKEDGCVRAVFNPSA